MNVDVLEGFIEVKGRYPILVTALHGFGSDRYRLVVRALKKYLKVVGYIKTLGFYDELIELVKYGSAVDVYTWEIAYKVAVSEELWGILPTLSKVDEIESMNIPDYNLNKSYASSTSFWRRVKELIEKESIRIIIDIHGMKNLKVWPDVCISTRGFTSSSKELAETLASYFMKQGLKVSIDFPFVGGAFIASFGKPPEVEALAVEIKRNLRFYGSRIPEIIRGAIKTIKYHLRSKYSLNFY